MRVPIQFAALQVDNYIVGLFTMDDEQQAYTVKEFCRMYAISRKTLYDLWKAGQGPVSYKIGRSRRVSPEPLRYGSRN